MMQRLTKSALAILAPLVLLGCIVAPGKFTSTLRIDADRHFSFAYQGEVIAVEPGDQMMKGLKDEGAEPTPSALKIATKPQADDTETKNRAIAAALAKETGYRSVVYKGKGKFLIDYAISGVLTHNFLYPFNSDAEIVLPFLVVELRRNGTVRLRAPGFANTSQGSAGAGLGPMGGGDMAKALDGVFTLDTDAEIVSQNNEDGPVARGVRHTITWRATPLTKDAPTAVLKMKP